MQVQPEVLPAFLRRESGLTVTAWSLVAAVAVIQALVLADLSNRNDVGIGLVSRVSIVPLWALATPIILRSARRWPAATWGPIVFLPINIVRHILLGSLFVVFANFAIQLPLLPTGNGVVAPALRDIAANYPAALVVYLVIVALGHVRARGNAEPPSNALTIRQWNRVHFIKLDDIDWIAADDNYIVVHAGGRSYKGRERISDVASQLDPQRFVRIHRSTIVQTCRIREVQPLSHGDHAVILRDGTQLRASRGRRQALSDALATRL